MAGDTLLITGASGMIGSAVAARLLRERVAVCALVHRHPPRPKVRCVWGDITRPRLGLSAAEHRALASQVTQILHCAARTEFSLPRAEADRANLTGTKHVIALARRCPNLQKIGVLSTAYVAGRRKGLILERDLEHRAGFVNHYESSKYRMEQFLRKEQNGLPIAVYRLSTIIGDARTGKVEQFNAVHQALRLYCHGLAPMVPGEEGSPIDLISSDYAVDAVCHLFHRTFQPGMTYHIVAGEENSWTLGELLESTAALFARFDKRWSARGVAMPPIVPLETFRLLESSVRKTGNSVLGQIVGIMSTFAPQLCYPKRFAAVNTEAGLAGAGIRPRALGEYYSRIVRYCLDNRWGSRR